jgi:hypothetical protein
VSRRNSIVCKLAVLNFVNHILDLLLSRVVTHSSHQVRKLINRYLLVVQFPCLCGVLLFRPDYTVVEKVIHILECLALSATLNKVDKRLDSFTSNCYCLLNWGYVNIPHVDGKIVATASKDVFAIGRAANVGNFIRMGN